MTSEIARLIQAPFDVAPPTREVVVYGAGNTGAAVTAYLAGAGHRVVAVLDAAARPGQSLHGVSVHRPAEWPDRRRAPEFDVVVAVHNYAVEMVALQAQIRGLGFRRTLNMIHFHNLFPVGQPFRFWLAPRALYRGHEHEIDGALSALGDATSRRWFRDVLMFRLTGDYGLLPAPSPADQYFPADLPRWKSPMRFVDCGAFNGDTIEALSHAGYAFEAIAAFEPDPDNYAALSRRLRECGSAIAFPCGVAGSTRQLRFATGAGTSSHEAPDGNAVIQCVALDDALCGFRPTFVKMDVEGSESDALEGARRMISSDRPSLAIALYHQPSHLWEIPRQIASWNLGYRLEIRGHGHGSYETVLYALPEERAGR